MQGIQDEIRQWLLSQPDWLQEAADRLLKQGALADTDLQAICAILKTPAGQAVTKHRTFDSLVDAPDVVSELRLIGIGGVLGIENLAPRQPLSFGNGNLTVIYGHNGSGKSSYTRILKKSSGKPRAIALKPNVFQDAPAQRKCQITYQVGNQPTTIEWHADAAPIDEIRAVDIFDSDEASHYLSKESAAAYTPHMVGMFESLATACDQLRAMLQAEQSQQVSALPAIPPNYALTEPARRYGALKAEMTDAAIQQLLSWTEEDGRKLDELNERLKVADPAALARQKRATKVQLEQIVGSLQQGVQAYGAEGLQAVRALQATAKAQRQIAAEAAQVGSAKLDGVGSSTWRALWEAARAYSQTAYPNQAFPVTDGARCVLCHQELTPDAQQRLRDFEVFVQGRLETDAKIAEAAYRGALESLPLVPSVEQIDTQCEAAGLTAGNWKQFLATFWSVALHVRSGLLAGEVEGQVLPVQDVSENVAELRGYCEQLESQAAQHDKDVQGFDRALAEKYKLALESQKWISQQADAVRKEIERLKRVKLYEDWKGLANPRKISVKAGDIAEKVITQAYVDRFNQELKYLGATHIKVEIVKTRIDHGKVLHQLHLKGVVNGQVMPDSVLSEGERRIISLAAFLADVANKPRVAPFIFDDPISSLDQAWEERTIDRLIQLSQTRQVVIFTHRLSMLGMITDKARGVDAIHIRHEPWGAGEAGEVPLYGKKPEAALNDLKNRRVAQARKELDAQGQDAYYPLAKAICSDLRILTERIVEQVFLADVVQRHRRAVNTQGKIHHLAKINTGDCDLIDEIMTKYSCYEHSQSQEAPVEIPGPDELEADINRLLSWHAEFTTR